VPAAAFLAGIAVPTIALTVGWRWAFRGAVLVALIAAATIPRHEEPHLINPPSRTDTSKSGKPATPLRLLVILAVAVGLGTGGVDTVAAFIVSYSVDVGLGENAAGLLLAIGSLCGVAARVIAGWLIDRIRHADLTAVAAMIGTGAAGVILLNLGGRPGLIIGGLLAFVAGWGWAGLFTFAVVKDNPDAPAAASGITQTGKYIGAALGAPIFRTIADRVSFTAAWWFTTSVLLIAAGLILYVRNQRPE
jgi:predicted MFS family arabinose efflux permease